MYKKFISLALICSVSMSPLVPCIAQMQVLPMHAHMSMPSPTSIPQHVWQVQSVNSQSSMHPTQNGSSAASSTSTHTHFFHHLRGTGSQESNSSAVKDNTNKVANYSTLHTFTRSFSPSSNNLPSHPLWLAAQSTRVWMNTSIGNPAHMPSINLDLSSSSQNMTAGHLLHNETINIKVGGTSLAVNSKTELTPAEYIAVMQVMSGGQQSLVIDAQGSASGGSVVIGSHLSSQLNSLVIPVGVTVIDLTKSGTLNIAGSITDDGSLYVGSTNHSLNTITVDAGNINVQSQGLVSDVLPGNSSGSQSFPVLNSTPINLSLDAANNIVNAGTIVSSGNLLLDAGGSISNAASSARDNASPLIQAANNINIYAGSGNITNSGLINAARGNINVNTVSNQSLTMNNANGTLQASNGEIDFRDANYADSANVSLNGGNYLSQAVNLNSGSGAVNVHVNQVSGVVNTYAGAADISANTPNLQMGVLDVSGDPWINNTGNIDLGTTISSSVPYLVATAGGSIYTSISGQSISTTGTGTGDIVLAAGVTATNNAGQLTLSRSGIGGDVYLATGSGSVSSQNIAGFSTGGGNVTLIAMTDTGSGSSNGGHVVLPTGVTINTISGGSAGAVNIFAEASTGGGNSVSIGGVNANGTGGAVVIESATANVGGATINSTTGAITGSFAGGTIQNGTVTTGAITAGGTLTMTTTGTIDLTGTNSAQSASLTATAVALASSTALSTTAALTIQSTTGALTVTNNGTSIAAGGSLTIQNTTTAAGSNLTISGTGSFTAGTSITLSTAGSNTLTFGSNVSLTPGSSGNTLTLTSSIVDFSSHTITDTESGSSVTINSPSGGLTIEAASGGTGTLVTTAGNISITPASGSLTFQSDGGSATTINLNTGQTALVTTTTGSSGTTVAANTTVSSDSAMTMIINGGTLTNSGTIQTVESIMYNATLTIESTSGPLTVVNNTGAIMSGGEGIVIQNTSASAGASVSISGAGTFEVPIDNIAISTAGSNTLSFGSNVSFSLGMSSNTLTLTSSIIDLGNYTLTNATQSSNIILNSPSGGLTVEAASGGVGQVEITGPTPGTISISPNSGLLTFQSDGASAAALILYASSGSASLSITSGSSGITVASNMTLALQGNTTLNITGGGTFTNNGFIGTSGGNRSVTVESTSGALTVINNNGATLGASSALTIKDTDATAGANLSLSGTGAYAAGTNIVVSTAGSNTVSFGSNTSFTPGTSSNTLTITSSKVDFGTFTVSNTKLNSAISITSPSGALTVEAGSGGTGTLVSDAGSISVTPSSGLLTFQTDGASAATVRLNTGGTGTLTIAPAGSSGITIAANTTLSSDSLITLNVNSGTLTNNGVVAYTGTATGTNSIILQSTSTLTLVGGNGSTTGLFNTGAASNTLKISGTTIDFSNGLIGDGTSGSAVTIISPSGGLTIEGGSGNTGGLSSNNGNISVTPNAGALTFQSDGGSATTIKLNGGSGTVTTTPGSFNTTIAANTTVSTNSVITMNVNGETFTNNGTLTSTNAAATSVILQSTSGMTIAGGNGSTSGLFNANGVQISVAGGSTLSLASGVDQDVTNGKISITADTIQGQGSGSATDTLGASGVINVQTATGGTTALAFTATTAGDKIALNGSTVTTTSENVSVPTGATLSSTGALTVNVNGGLITNNGTIETASGGGALTVENTTGSFTVDGTGTYSTSANNNNVIFQANSSSSTGITFGGTAGLNATVNTGSGQTDIVTQNVIAASVAGGSTPSTPTLTTNSSNSSGTVVEAVTSGIGTAVTFKNDGAGAAQLDLNGSPVTAIGTNITENANTTLSSNNSITMQVNGVMTNAGTIQTVAGGGTITVESYNASSYTLDGTGLYSTSANNSNVVFSANNIYMGGTSGLNTAVHTGSGVLQINVDNIIVNTGVNTPTNPVITETGSGINVSIETTSGTISSNGSGSPTLFLSGAPVTISSPYVLTLNLTGTTTLESNDGMTVNAAQVFLNSNTILENVSSGSLHLQGTGTNNSLYVSFAPGSEITNTAGIIGFNPTTAGPITIVNTGSGPAYGLISAQGGLSYVDFNVTDSGSVAAGTPGAVNATVNQISGIIRAAGNPVNINVATGSNNITIGGVTTDGGTFVLMAGSPTTTGNITITGTIDTSSTTGNGGNVFIVSAGTTSVISGQNITTSSSAAGDNAGAVVVSSAVGAITLGTITTTATNGGNGGDVLLTTADTSAGSISVTGINTSTNSSSANAGQIWVSTTTAGISNITTGNTTQNQGSGGSIVREANPVFAVNSTSAITGGTTQQIIFTPNNIFASQAGSISGFSPGGFTSISDSAGAVDIKGSIGGIAVTDNSLVIPIISTNTFSLGNSTGSIIQIPTSSHGMPGGVAFFGPVGITIGSSGTNPVSLTTNGQGTLYIGAIGSNGGDVVIDNNVLNQAVDLGSTVVNGNLTFTNMGNFQIDPSSTVNVSAAVTITLTTGGVNGLSFSDNGTMQALNSITIQETDGETFTLSGTAAFNYTQTSGNNLYVKSTGSSTPLMALTNGLDWTTSAATNINLTSPTITVGVTGETGAVSAAFNTSRNNNSDGEIFVYANGSNTGSLLLNYVSGASSGTLNLNGNYVTTTSTNLTIPQNMIILAGDSAITMNVNSGTFSNPGTVQSTNGWIYLTSTGTLLIDASHGVLNPGIGESVQIQAATSLTLTNNGEQTLPAATENLYVLTPQIFVGAPSDSGTVSYLFLTTGGSIQWNGVNGTYYGSSGESPIELSLGGTAGSVTAATLYLNTGGSGTLTTNTNFLMTVDQGTTLSSDSLITMNLSPVTSTINEFNNNGTIVYTGSQNNQTTITLQATNSNPGLPAFLTIAGGNGSTQGLLKTGATNSAKIYVDGYYTTGSTLYLTGASNQTVQQGALSIIANTIQGTGSNTQTDTLTVVGAITVQPSNAVYPSTSDNLIFSVTTSGNTIALNGSSLTTTSNTLTVNSGVILSAASPMTMNVSGGTTMNSEGTITNNGTIKTTGSNALTLQATSGLFTVNNNSGATVTAGGALTIQDSDSTSGANLLISGTGAFTAGTNITASTAGSNKISFGNNMSFSPGSSSNTLTITSSIVDLESYIVTDARSGSGITVNSASGGLTLEGGNTSAGTLLTTAGNISIAPNSGILTFQPDGLTPTSTTINLNTGGSGTVTTTAGSFGTAIAANTTVSSDSSMTMNTDGGTFTNSGTVETSGSNSLTLGATSGAVTVTNNSGAAIQAGGALNIQDSDSTSGSNLTISGTGSFTAGTNVTLSTSGSNKISFGNNISFTTGSFSNTLTVSSSILDLGSHTLSDATSGSGITVTSPSGGLTIEGGSGGTGTLLTNSGNISVISNSGLLTFQSDGGSATTINLNTSDLSIVTITASSSGTTVAANTTVSSDSEMTMNTNGGTLTNNGTIETTGNNGLTLQATSGTLTVINNSGAIIQASGSLFIQSTSSSSGANLSISGPGSFTAGLVVELSTSGTNTLSFGNSTSFTTGSSNDTLAITSSTVDFGSHTVTDARSGSSILIESTFGGLTLKGSSGGAGTLLSTGGNITIEPASGVLTFQSDGASATTIALNTSGSGTVISIAGSSGIIVAANTTVSSDSAMTMDLSNGGPLTNSGTIETSGSKALTLESVSGALTVTNNSAATITAGGVLTIEDTDITSGSNLTISGTGSFTAGTNVALSAAGSNTLNFVSNSSFTPGTSSNTLTMTSSTIDFGSNTVTDARSGSGITITSPSGALTVEGASGGTGMLSSTAGNISITPNSGLLTFQSDGASATIIALNTGGTGTVSTTSGVSGTAIATNTTVSSDSAITMNVNGGTFTNNGIVEFSPVAVVGATITVQSTGTLALAGTTGTWSPGVGNQLSISAPTSITLTNGLSQTVSNGSAVNISTALLQGAGSGSTSTLTSSASYMLTSPVTSLQIGSAVSNSTINLNGSAVNATSNTFSINSGATLSSDHNITVSSVSGNILTIAATATGTLNTTGQVQLLSNTGVTFNTGSNLQITGTGATTSIYTPQVAGTGEITTASTTTFTSPTSTLAYANNANLTFAGGGAVILQSPTIQVGINSDTGALTSTITVSGTITLETNSSQTGNLVFSTNTAGGATSGTLNLNGAPIAITATNATINANTTLSSAIGSNGGTMIFTVPGITTVNGVVEANGTTGTGGMILFTLPNSNLTVVNNGAIEARSLSGSNTTGNVGFNGGENGQISVTGTGEIYGGGYVDFGNLDTNTLLVIPPLIHIYPTTGNSYSYTGLYNTNGTINISQNIDPIQVNVSAYNPIIPIVPSSIQSSSQNAQIAYERLLYFELLRQEEINSQQQQTNIQIGTRIATDYTPIWSPRTSTYMASGFPGPWFHTDAIPKSPLQGYVINEKLSKIGKGLFASSSFNANELTALSNQGIVFGASSKNSFFDLIKGYVLFMPTEDISVQTREGLVSIPKGAIAWIMETGNDVAIYDLHDNLHTRPIEVTVNKKNLTLSPGTQVLLTRNTTADFDSLNPGNNIGYRNLKASDAGDGIKAYICDFSITHGLANVPFISHLVNSKDPAQRKIAWKIIKNATILADLTGADYKTGTPATTH